MLIAFRTFQTRVVVSFLILITLVQLGSLVAVHSAVERSARAHVTAELATSAKVVTRLLESRSQRLIEAARILSADFAFKQVVALGDDHTLRSAMDNHRVRLDADLMLMASLHHRHIVLTPHRPEGPPASERLTGMSRLMETAAEAGEAADFMLVDGEPYQVVVVPLLAPAAIAWISMGFRIDRALAAELHAITASEVSFEYARPDGRWTAAVPSAAIAPPPDELETLEVQLPSVTGAGIKVVLRRSLVEAMAPYRYLRAALLALLAVAAAVSIGGGLWIARGVSRPVRQLAEAARRIEAGAYGGSVAMPQRDELGELAATFNRMSTAVAEREERLRESEERFRTMTESAVDAVVTADSRGNIVTWNRGAQATFGYAAAAVLGTPLARLLAERHRRAGGDGLAHLRAAGSGASPRSVELHGLRADGREFPIELSLASWKTGQGVFSTAIIRDVTERRQLEAQFRQAQKMESVGRLAGGVAHDFNNVLTVISSHAEIAETRLPADHPVLRRIRVIQDAAARAADLTRQLLAFSRKQVLAPKVLTLDAVVNEIAPMLRRLIGEDVELVTRSAEGLGRVEADPGQITQIVLNLAVNARDAMPDGGRLTIETTNVDLDEAFTEWRAEARPGPYVALVVSDTGIGMDEATRSHIFEPFFTTKEPGKGTGLGLATVYGIVKQSHGHVGVYSEPGRGTTFRVYLPRVERPVEGAAPERPARVAGGSETILLVEDDDRVRALGCEILQEHGYTVLEARHAEDAVDIAQRYHGAIHLLLTDVIMPGMGGRELAIRLRPGRPRMRILYMSGYTADVIVHHGVLDGSEVFLPKPLTPTTLLAKVREALDTEVRTTIATG